MILKLRKSLKKMLAVKETLTLKLKVQVPESQCVMKLRAKMDYRRKSQTIFIFAIGYLANNCKFCTAITNKHSNNARYCRTN